MTERAQKRPPLNRRGLLLLATTAALAAGAVSMVRRAAPAGVESSEAGGSSPAGTAAVADRARRTPPRLVMDRSADPASALPDDYDPNGLVDRGGDPIEIYAREPRQESAASLLESEVGARMRQDLARMLPEAREVTMVCHTLSCQVTIEVPPAKRKAALAIVRFVALGPTTVELPAGPDDPARCLFFLDRATEPAALVASYQQGRRQLLADIKAGRQPNPFPVPLRALPVE